MATLKRGPLGKYEPKLTPEQVDALVDLVRQGTTVAQASRQFHITQAAGSYHVSQAAMRELLEGAGLPGDLKPWTLLRLDRGGAGSRTRSAGPTPPDQPPLAAIAENARVAGEALLALARRANASA
jgi:hypothetical protein